MSVLETVTDIRADILWRGGEDPTNTSGDYYSKSLEYINRAYRDLVRGNSPLDPSANAIFSWAVKHPPASFILEPKYDTGTVLVTNGSASVTFSGTIASSVANWHLMIDGFEDVFRITAHTAGTATATIDANYTGTTAAAATYKLMKLEYTIGSNDIIRVISPFRIYRPRDLERNYKIYGLARDRFDSYYPLNMIRSGVPEAFKVNHISANNVVIQVNRYREDSQLKVEYDYIAYPAELTAATPSSSILVPKEYRFVIADWALAFIYKDKSDGRYQEAISLAQAGFKSMVNDYLYNSADVDETYGQIISRDDDYNFQNSVLRTDSGAIIGFVY